MNDTAIITTLQQELLTALRYEVYRALRVHRDNWKTNLLDFFLQVSLMRFVQLASQFEKEAAIGGFAYASRRIVPEFVPTIEVSGAENIPTQGPLIVVGNHPGSLDALIVAAQLYRQDLKLIARDMSFLRRLPGIDACMLYSTKEIGRRAVVLRQALHHLACGGSLLFFASGRLDPDPAWMPGAMEAIDLWTGSAAFLLKRVPEARVVIAITSRLIDPRWLTNPLISFHKDLWDRQFLAELMQNCMQLSFSYKNRVSPKVTFSDCYSISNLSVNQNSNEIRDSLIEIAKQQTLLHINSIHTLDCN